MGFFKYVGHVGLKGKKINGLSFGTTAQWARAMNCAKPLKKIRHDTTQPIHLMSRAEPAYEP